MIGSNRSMNTSEDCIEKLLAINAKTSNSEPQEILMWLPNDSFEIGYRMDDNDELLMTEYVPLGETLHDWTQKITIQSLIGYRPEDLKSFAISFSQKVVDQCSKGDHEIIWS